MKNIIKRISYLTLLIGLLFSCSKDGLTEEEILTLDQQGWRYSIHLKNPYTEQPVVGAEVQVVVNGEPKTLTSNSAGTVEFEAGYLGEFNISVSRDGYFDLNKQVSPSGDNRSKNLRANIDLFPSEGEGTITVQGNITVQSNLTTVEKEPASGASFYVEFYHRYNYTMRIDAKADNDGNYSIKIPALDYNNNYGYYKFYYNPYLTSQKIAINRFSDEPDFPETLPSVVDLQTTFGPGSLISIPNVRPVYATIPAPPVGPGSQQGSPFYLNLDGNGGVSVGTIGINTGAGYTAGDKPLSIVSILGGSGSVGVIRDTNANGVLDQYEITAGGSEYPKTTYININTQSFSATKFNNGSSYYYYSNDFRPGAIFVNNVFLGTGIEREKAVN